MIIWYRLRSIYPKKVSHKIFTVYIIAHTRSSSILSLSLSLSLSHTHTHTCMHTHTHSLNQCRNLMSVSLLQYSGTRVWKSTTELPGTLTSFTRSASPTSPSQPLTTHLSLIHVNTLVIVVIYVWHDLAVSETAGPVGGESDNCHV